MLGDSLLLRHRQPLNLEIGGGLGVLAGTIWRIGLMGYGSSPENVLRCLEALGTVLADEGLSVSKEEAIAEAQQALAEEATT